MKKAITLYEQGSHRWFVIARDPDKPHCLIDTNEYVITHAGQALLTDPGGLEIFPAVFSAVSEVIDPAQVGQIFASHQDPDVISSLALWLEFNPDLRCHVSGLWKSFIPHFGGDEHTLLSIADDGADIDLHGHPLHAIPAHYLHSSGNFHLWDAKAQILFSGDIGAAMLPHDQQEIFVRDFAQHIRHAEGFHRRWMGSNSAKRDWCERAAKLPIDMLCPQHGAIYQGDDVMRFINWLDELKVGLF
ncbi:MBL fold metallo-hydrolase [Atopomonas sediminilitoris]|uniref:MBL fold metallo-hydrolase n=1 Tax=Atopomonas sediminilitoris TaxID=2919919 RepID=UPI001F4D9050|nr:MBL fold metallo-hydrolase [Atopomonas sediminilitoris]MCJ8169155.1 FprA family A-type flavoprotein [Atopomonas sediminilitoris]